LDYFKKSRQLESSLEKTFLNNFINEIEDTIFNDINNPNNDIVNLSDDSFDNSVQIFDGGDNMLEYSQQSVSESPVGKFEESPSNFNKMNMSNDFANMVGMSYAEGFSCIKTDDIKEYLTNFGDGNKDIFKNLPHYQQFAKGFSQLDKNNIFLKNNFNKPEQGQGQGKRQKKEEKLFEFGTEFEIKSSEIFTKESKAKSNLVQRETKKEKKRKVKQYYNYDKAM
jgi:hypothetical protein